MTIKESPFSWSSEILIFRRIAYILSLLLIFILPWRAMLTLAPSITAARLVGALAGLFWIAYLVFYSRMRRLDPFHVVLFTFVTWMGVSSAWSIDIPATLFTFFSLFASTLFCVVLWDLFRTEEDIASAALAYVLGCYIVILIEGYDFLFLGSSRLADVISGPNYIAPRLAFGLPLAWFLVVRPSLYNRQKLQYIAAVYIPTASIAILLTESRQGFVLLIVALMLLFGMHAYSKSELQRSIGVGIGVSAPALIIGIYALGDRFWQVLPIDRLERILGVLTGDVSFADATLDDRFEIYSAGTEVFRSHFLYGTGAGTFPKAVEPLLGTPRSPHSTYFAIGSELGVVGLFLFSILFVYLSKGIVDLNSEKKIMGLSLLVLYLLASLVNTWLTSFTALFVLTVVLLSSRSSR